MTPVAPGAGRPRRLLVINPNTNGAVTMQIREAALAVAPPGTEIEVVNPAHGPFAIETPLDRTEAVPNVVSLIEARRDEGFDGYVLACFDDIGVEEARKLVPVPVVSMFGAAIARGAETGGRFAIITTVESAVAGIEHLAAAYGVAHLCTVRAAGIGVAETAARTPLAEARLIAAIERAMVEDRAAAIVLGSGALTGRADALAKRFGIPFIDGLTAAVVSADGGPGS
ncbi:aspartate/glutamate racemase family protein [Mesorhizobium sp. 8]|uniref:aspartate/glutamate racemase family protein n=1 Tax=Mesorhizobium sp. 8 TaxID=2584466 RepID=UPI00112357A9|nr:aspartate/glutamate racemase family protein [Mesorhizobium sp. 8]QDC00143.1 Asp/Glu racemase [Mesorhizobium sp. 8]